ncbi:hypothetical protein MCOR27_002684 [Pyricularia oryzae]|uniref:Uncharacterized protein n=1 Tax=Pyricularia grisea TaxID=148305 RepID=A0ABQ8NUI8_PYRGI|nr:hypothetical protein MCOR02_006486 [Pyricularia oryzae]KAI6302350.1 hypothetical protein MCOR33_002250 [Pyricularia grisea]KAI6284554.1 hypothetical protein MCOR27_002684 [Pyricularia oryzae]KAI6317098.1 hypothetical protein MCOR34_004076 [Pyricularia oryzae]KAI6323471.1 hypothetical protein MCOR29_004411 [Pyricularia oryzae]
MFSLKAFLLVSVSCLAQLAAAGPLEYAGLEARGQIVVCPVTGAPNGDIASGKMCTSCGPGCITVAKQPPCCPP